MTQNPRTVVTLLDDLSSFHGTEVHLHRLLTNLDPTRYRGVVAVVGAADLAPEFQRDGVPVHPLEIHRTFAPGGLRGVAKIAGLLRREGASLLVTYHTASDLLGPVAARLARIPVVSCRRDEGFTKKAFHVRVQRLLNPLLGGMITVSGAVAEAVHGAEGYPRQQIQTIWNGEDLALFSPGRSRLRQQLGISPETFVMTTAAYFHPIKDHRTQIAALVRLSRHHPDACLLLAGFGPLQDELQRQAAPLGQRVRFIGQRDDMPEVLRASDVYLQSSLSEGFSNAIIQAMASALPVVATRVGGNPELVRPACGFMVPPRDPDALAQKLSLLASSPERRQQMGQAGREWVERHCSLDLMVRAYMDAFDRIVVGRFPGPSSGSMARAGPPWTG